MIDGNDKERRLEGRVAELQAALQQHRAGESTAAGASGDGGTRAAELRDKADGHKVRFFGAVLFQLSGCILCRQQPRGRAARDEGQQHRLTCSKRYVSTEQWMGTTVSSPNLQLCCILVSTQTNHCRSLMTAML